MNRYRRYGHLGLVDRSSAPARQPTATPGMLVEQIESMRREHKWSASRIAFELEGAGTPVSRRTITRLLAQLGLNRRKFIDPNGESNREPQRISAVMPQRGGSGGWPGGRYGRVSRPYPVGFGCSLVERQRDLDGVPAARTFAEHGLAGDRDVQLGSERHDRNQGVFEADDSETTQGGAVDRASAAGAAGLPDLQSEELGDGARDRRDAFDCEDDRPDRGNNRHETTCAGFRMSTYEFRTYSPRRLSRLARNAEADLQVRVQNFPSMPNWRCLDVGRNVRPQSSHLIMLVISPSGPSASARQRSGPRPRRSRRPPFGSCAPQRS